MSFNKIEPLFQTPLFEKEIFKENFDLMNENHFLQTQCPFCLQN